MKKTTRAAVAALLAVCWLGVAAQSAAAQPPAKPNDQGKKDPPPTEPPKKDQTPAQKKAAEQALGELRPRGEAAQKKAAAEADPLEAERLAFKKLQYENYRNDQRIPVPGLTGGEVPGFTGGTADDRVILKKARFEVARFTDASEDMKQAEIHLTILRFLQGRNAAADDEFKAKYKGFLLQACGEFLVDKDARFNVSTYAKINMLALIDELHEFKDLAEGKTGIGAAIKVLGDFKRHSDGVLFVAMDVLSRAKARQQTTVEEEGRAAVALLAIGKRGLYQELFLEKLCRTLGEIKRAYLPQGVPERVEIATFLGGVVMNDNAAELTRITAATAVGGLDVSAVVNWDFATQASVLGRGWKVYLDVAKANVLADSPKVSKQRLGFMGGKLMESTKIASKNAETAGAQPAVTAKLTSLMDAALPGLNDVLEGKEPELDAITNWNDANKPGKLQFSPRAEPIFIENKRTTVAGPAPTGR